MTTIREWMATACLVAMVQREKTGGGYGTTQHYNCMARGAVAYADALLKALKEKRRK